MKSIIAGNPDSEINQLIQAKAAALLASGKITENNLKYLQQLDLSIVKSDLDISDLLLERLRLNCQLFDVELRPREITSHRKFVGPVIVAVKKLIFPVIKFFLKDFIRQQKDFNASLIATLGQIAVEKKQKPNISSEL